MTSVSKLYCEIFSDMQNSDNIIKSRMARMIKTDYPVAAIFSVNRTVKTREFCIRIDGSIELKRFPKWKGIEIDTVFIDDYNNEKGNFLRLKQLPDFEGEIFEIVVQNLWDNILHVGEIAILKEVETVLAKWKEFFSFSNDIIMSPEKQQGLYGELLMLQELVEKYDTQAVYFWMGSNFEAHDFYVNSNAIEVKTTSGKAPYLVSISSENQLDDSDITGYLLLRVYALRRSEADGESLPECIDILQQKLQHDINALSEFQRKLWKTGYISTNTQLYKYRFTVREDFTYVIRENFPRFIRKDLKNGIGSLNYSLSLSACSNFLHQTNIFELFV